MSHTNPSLIVLEPGQTPPPEATAPPRQPQWLDTVAYIAKPEQFCRHNTEKYGPIFRTSIFGGTTVLLGAAAANKIVFNGDAQYTEISLPPTTMAMFGEYSLFQRPDLHRQRRNALSPGLTGLALAEYTPTINRIVIEQLQTWPTPAPLAVFPEVEKVCFDVLVPLLLGIELNTNHDSDPFAGLPITSKQKLRQRYAVFFDGFYGLLKWESPLTAYGRGMKARNQLLEFMRAVIQRRREQAHESAEADAKADFLSMMLAGQQDDVAGVFSDDLIENQCLLQLWASHKNIATLISSMMYRLGQHPHLIQKLLEEQAQVMPETASEQHPHLSWQQLKQLTFLDATLKETLRHCPLGSTVNRRLTKDIVLDGMLLKKGWVLIAEPRISHILTEHFADPEQFMPERFLRDRQGIQPYTFIPFGGGIHACLGAQMTFVLSKIFAFHLLRQFQWTLTGTAKFVQFPLKRLDDRYAVQLSRR